MCSSFIEERQYFDDLFDRPSNLISKYYIPKFIPGKLYIVANKLEYNLPVEKNFIARNENGKKDVPEGEILTFLKEDFCYYKYKKDNDIKKNLLYTFCTKTKSFLQNHSWEYF